MNKHTFKMDEYDEEQARHNFFNKKVDVSKKTLNTQPKNSDAARLLLRIHEIERNNTYDQYELLPPLYDRLEKLAIQICSKVRCLKRHGNELEFERMVRQYVVLIVKPKLHLRDTTVPPFYELKDLHKKEDNEDHDEEKGYEPDIDYSEVQMV